MNADRERALDSLSRKLANAPLEDEEISEEEERAVAEALEWLTTSPFPWRRSSLSLA